MKNILIVDDHPMFRKGLMNVLQGVRSPQITCAEAGCGEEALALLSSQSYDLAIVDISMPGMGGMALLENLHRTKSELPVLVLSMYSEDQFALKALRLGAAGYLTKMEADDELITAVSLILAGKRYLSRSLSETLIKKATEQPVGSSPSHSCLSSREMDILRRIAAGQSLKWIAGDLNLSIKTVSTYKSRMFSKMGFNNGAELVTYAIQHQLT